MSDAPLVLHPLDQIAPRCYIRGLLCFPLPDASLDRHLTALQASLDLTTKQSPFLAGTLQFQSHDTGRLQLILPLGEPEKKLKVKHLPDFGHTYEELRQLGMPMRHLPLSFGPFEEFRPDLSSPVEIFGVQANIIPGGLILAIYMHHALIDGIGYAKIATQLARNCFLILNQQAEDNQTAVDFSSFEWTDSILPLDSGIPGYPVYNLSPKASNGETKVIHQPQPPKIVSTFVIHSSSIRKLKEQLIAKLHDPGQANKAWISTYDTILALFWSSTTLARLRCGVTPKSSSITSQLIYPTDSRKKLELPTLYCHNAGIRTLTEPIPITSFQNSTAFLAKAALNVRRSTDCVTKDLAEKVVSLVESLPDVRALQRPPGTDIGLSGQYDLMFTSWAQMPLYDLDWGGDLGKVDWVRVCPHKPEGWDGLGYIMPERRRDGLEAGQGEFEVVLGLTTDAMNALRGDVYFMQWVKEVVE